MVGLPDCGCASEGWGVGGGGLGTACGCSTMKMEHRDCELSDCMRCVQTGVDSNPVLKYYLSICTSIVFHLA